MLRSRALMESSGLILLVLDGSEPVSAEDRILIDETEGRARIIVINKSDLPQKHGASACPGQAAIRISAKTEEALTD